MTNYVMDSFAWIEYFRGSDKGTEVKKLVEATDSETITNIVNLSEIISVIKRGGRDHKEAFEHILAHSKIFPLDIDFAREAGELHADTKKLIKDFGLADAFVLLTARRLGAKILTGDPHFKGFKKSIML